MEPATMSNAEPARLMKSLAVEVRIAAIPFGYLQHWMSHRSKAATRQIMTRTVASHVKRPPRVDSSPRWIYSLRMNARRESRSLHH